MSLTNGEPKSMTIAIDGPVASGKSVVGSELARRLGIRFLDTGMMYRAFTWKTLAMGLDETNEQAVTELAESLVIRMERRNGRDALFVNGEDSTPHLKSASVDRVVSHVSAVSAVRRRLVTLQRKIAEEEPIVMVGRDIGTVVLADATLKIYLRATVEVRARRRYLEMQQRSESANYKEVEAALALRDKMDTERADSPLQAAKDAVVIDSDQLSIQQTVDKILKLLEDR